LPASVAFDRSKWAIAAFTLLAAALRFSTLGAQSFWSDEAVTVALARLDFAGMLRLIPDSESTPPLYYILAWPWTRVFGFDEVGVRSLSALAGTATVPLAAAAAWTLASRRAAVATAALVALNPLLVWYSQEARAYALLVLTVALAFLVFALALERPTRGRLAAWSATSVLALATHYFAAFVLVPQAALLLIRHRRRALTWVVLFCLGGGALIPLAVAQRGTGSAEWIARAPLDSRIATLAKQLLVGRAAPFDRPLAMLAALLVLTAIALLPAAGTRARRGAGIAAAVGVTALLAPTVLAALGLDYIITQNVLAAVVPLSVAVSVGFAASDPRWVGASALACLSAIFLVIVIAVSTDAAYQRANWRGAAEAAARPGGSRVIVLDNDFGGWFARLPFLLYLPEARAMDRGLATAPQRFPERLRRRAQDNAVPRPIATRELVFVNIEGESACGIGSPRLFRGFRLVERDEGSGYGLLRYRRPSPVALDPQIISSCLPDDEVAILVEEK
jgi:4-amino-4-deoxy-L-arabinose transferase-like glycosyltransferase